MQTPLNAPQPKLSKKQAHIRAAIGQIMNEPVEIAQAAGEQLVGSTIQQSAESQHQFSPEEVAKQKEKDARHLQAFREEAREIERLRKQRAQEIEQQRRHEEAAKKRAEEQKKQQNPLVEPATKIKRGMLGAAGKIGLRRKQTQVEIQKTQSN